MEAKTLLQFHKDKTFADGFGGEVVTRNRIVLMTGKEVKILFFLNRQSKMVRTCMDYSIGGRARHGTKNTFQIP